MCKYLFLFLNTSPCWCLCYEKPDLSYDMGKFPRKVLITKIHTAFFSAFSIFCSKITKVQKDLTFQLVFIYLAFFKFVSNPSLRMKKNNQFSSNRNNSNFFCGARVILSGANFSLEGGGTPSNQWLTRYFGSHTDRQRSFYFIIEISYLTSHQATIES